MKKNHHYHKTVLSNGLRVITHEMPDRESLSLGIWIGVGGRYEEDKIKGAAHFLEHIVFKGSKKYSCEQIKTNIEGVGGTLNAFTSEEQTCYYVKILAKHLERSFDVLSDMVFHPKITSKDMEKERTVIIEEIKMYNDLPQYFVTQILDEMLWPNHPLGKNLAGSIESVSGISHKDLRNFHTHYYAPRNVVIAACGQLKHQQIVNLVKKRLGTINTHATWNYQKVENKQDQYRARFHKKEIEQIHLALGMLAYNEHDPKRFALSLLSIILGGNMSSRLFVEVREKKGLAYSIGSSSKSMHDTGMFVVRAGVDKDKLVEALRVIFKELEKIRQKGVGEDEFQRAKDYLLGQVALGLEDTMEQMLWFGEMLISRDLVKTPKEIIGEYNKVTREDIKMVAQEILNKKMFNLALIGPITDKQEKEIKSLLD